MAPLRLPSVPWDKINLMEIVLPAPFSYPQRFSIPETSDTPKASLTKILSTVSWKVFDGELLYSPSPRPTLTSNNLFVIRNLLKHRGVPLRSVSLLRNKHFWSTVVTPRPFLSLFFSIWKTFWNTEGFLYEIFWYCETKKFYGESWYPSRFYAWKISMLDLFSNEEVFPNEMCRYCEAKKLTRILMPTPFLFLKVFRYQKFSETQKVSLTKAFLTVKQNRFT